MCWSLWMALFAPRLLSVTAIKTMTKSHLEQENVSIPSIPGSLSVEGKPRQELKRDHAGTLLTGSPLPAQLPVRI